MSSNKKRTEVDEAESSSDEDEFGPTPVAPAPAETEVPVAVPKKKKKKRKLEHEEAYVAALPSADMYEKSYMHRDVVTHCAFTPRTDFLVTASEDGHVKFWKKMPEGLEFVKHYHAHLGPVHSVAVSGDGLRLATTGQDKAIKLYDVLTFDLTYMIDVDYIPTHAAWIHKPGEPHGRLAVADADSPCLRIYRTDGSQEPIHTFPKLHSAPVGLAFWMAPHHLSGDFGPFIGFFHTNQVTALAFSAANGIAVSTDAKGVIEYWSTEDEYGFPRGKVSFKVRTCCI